MAKVRTKRKDDQRHRPLSDDEHRRNTAKILRTAGNRNKRHASVSSWPKLNLGIDKNGQRKRTEILTTVQTIHSLPITLTKASIVQHSGNFF